MADYLNGGLYRILFWEIFTASNVGYMGGSAGISLAAGDTSHAFVVDSINNFTPEGGEIVKQTFQGGDQNLGTMQFGDSGLTGFNFTMEDVRSTLVANMHGSAVDTTSNSFYEMFSFYANANASVAVGAAIITTLKDRSTAAKKFRTTVFPSCSLIFSPVYGGFQGKNTVQASVSISPADYHPLGTAISALSMSVSGGRVDSFEMITDYPVGMTVYRSNGSDTTFTAGYRPISTVVTVNATPNWFARNGTDQALTSIVDTTGVATMAAAGTSGDVNVLIYQTNYVPI